MTHVKDRIAALGPACLLFALTAPATASPGPEPLALPAAIAAPVDRPYPGVVRVSVDATDVQRRIVRIHETVPVVDGADTVLLLPEWLPGWHAPGGRFHVNRIAGLRITASGSAAALKWERDAVNVFAFHVAVPPGTASLDLEFQYLSPPSAEIGELEATQNIWILEWPSLVLYPAGYFARQVPVDAQLKVPAGWHIATALEPVSTLTTSTEFRRTDLETLVDSPVYAGEHWSRVELDPGAAVPVYLDLFAERPQLLASTPAQIGAHRALVQQAYKLFGSRHYDRYDFLLTLSDGIEMNGLEHHRSSENSSYSTYFTEWDKRSDVRDLLAHEFVHSWNGKFRRPADLWAPNFNVPERNSLLWVYEGQTQYWGLVLSARCGLWSKQEALEQLAYVAAWYGAAPGRTWRPLQDTTNDEIFSPRALRQPWTSWQGFEDYYDVGQLIWLDADTLIRQRSNGRRSLDDFAQLFFGGNDGSFTPVTYSFEDVVATLDRAQPHDWTAFLRERLDAVNIPAPMDGITRGGYRLVFNDVASELYKSRELRLKATDLTFSLGLTVDKDGKLRDVLWEGPAYRAGLTVDNVLVAVNGVAFDPDRLKEAVSAARTARDPIQLIVRSGDRFRVAQLDYHDGLRYPHLERDPAHSALLDEILAPRK
ncbi:MAG TPA: peptidase M61 [Burkholderiaceae bacterium]|nr:peptidase M61 [Burkholderiaceae bacterium]